MTGVLEAPAVADETPEATDASAPRRGGWSRLRAELRLAWSQVRRNTGASVLVAALVALPMVPLAGAAVIIASKIPTLAQEVDLELGSAAARLDIVSGPDPSLWQSPADPYYWEIARGDDGVPVNPELPPLADPVALLPSGTEVIEIAAGLATAETPTGIVNVGATVGDAWDPALAGRFELRDGRAPTRAGEAMVSPGALDRLGLTIGETLALTDPEASFTITGVLTDAQQPDSAGHVFVPKTRATGSIGELRQWFTPEWQPTAGGLDALNQQGVVVFARDLMLAREGGRYVDPGSAWALGSVVAIVSVFAAYLIVLLAGAAFSVSARRQQHALAVAASVGASTRSVFRVVLLQGTLLGLAGGIAGAALGIAGAYPLLVLLDDGRASSFWGFAVPWWGIALVVLFAVAAGTASAIVPARAATRGDVMRALRGARTPVSVSARRPLWGTAFLGFGIAVTLLSGLALAGLNAAEVIDYGHPLRLAATWGIVIGPITFQIGVILAAHWLLALLARGAAWFGLPARIAARDAVANPGRIVPAFGAIAACVFIAAFALSATAIISASSARHHWWQAPDGDVALWIMAMDAASEEATVARARQALTASDPASIATLRTESSTYEVVDGVPSDDRLRTIFRAERATAPECASTSDASCMTEWQRAGGWDSAPWVVEADELSTALGMPVPDRTLAAFENGAAIVSENPNLSARIVSDGAVTINEWPGAMLAPDAYFTEHGTTLPDPVSTWTLPAVEIDPPHAVPWTLIISPETAESLGYRPGVQSLIGQYDPPPGPAAIDGLSLAAEESWSKDGTGFSFHLESGPADPSPWLWLILGSAGTLVLGASAVALALARIERRPDDATLTAVGAGSLVRRGIAGWQSVVIVGLAGITGTLAGLIPMWGITLAMDDLRLADAPWLWLALLAVGLPLAIAVVSWLVPPRHPDLTRRTAIT